MWRSVAQMAGAMPRVQCLEYTGRERCRSAGKQSLCGACRNNRFAEACGCGGGRNPASTFRYQRVRSRTRRRAGARRCGADRRRPRDRQIDLAVAGAMPCRQGKEGALCQWRRVRAADRHAGQASGAGWRSDRPAGRNPAGEDSRHPAKPQA